MTVNRRGFLATTALATPALVAASGTHQARATPHHAANGPLTQSRSVRTGAEASAEAGWHDLDGRNIGVLSNPTGVLSNLDHIVDSMVAAGLRPAAAFGPEHGFRGSAQAGGSVGDYVDPHTGIPVYDAYGASADELAGMFTKGGIDTLVFDIADVGARFYTYIWSMYTALLAAGKTGTMFIVLDRPNPIGDRVSGPLLDRAFSSGVGLEPIALQHGMTAGELARLFAGEFLPQRGIQPPEIDVVEVRGWRRSTPFDGTGLTWTPPSPNMPTPSTALAYPGTGLFEGAVFSEGRGTTSPFEIIGAPGVDWRWRDELTGLGLTGVTFRETYFVPTFGKFVGESCGGVQLTVTDPRSFDPVRTAVSMIVTAKRLHPDLFGWRKDNFIDKLSGSARLRTMVDSGAGIDEIIGAWSGELDQFTQQRKRYLIYQ